MTYLYRDEKAELKRAWCEWSGHDHPLDAHQLLLEEFADVPPCPSAEEFVNDLGPLIADLMEARSIREEMERRGIVRGVRD